MCDDTHSIAGELDAGHQAALDEFEQEHKAAILMQAHWRGHFARKQALGIDVKALAAALSDLATKKRGFTALIFWATFLATLRQVRRERAVSLFSCRRPPPLRLLSALSIVATVVDSSAAL